MPSMAGWELEVTGYVEKAARMGAAFAPGVLDFVAAPFDGSVRELEGLLTALVSHARLAGRQRGEKQGRANVGWLTKREEWLG